jgi:acetoin utilization deacetylase AcuC-like enzyme
MPRLFYCDHHTIPLPPGHKFPMAKYALLRDHLTADGFFHLEPAPLAERELIELIHDPAYVCAFLAGTLDPRIMRRIGFPWSEALVRRSLASLGGTLAATRDALDSGFGGNLAGGTHHAFRAEGSGFCVFNDIAVAIQSLRVQSRIRRAAVVDLDVHQGDGTAAIFERDPEVFTLSLHGENNFPFRKQQSRLDVALPDGTEDAAYLAALDKALPQVAVFSPEIIFYQSGVDALAGDKLGRLSLSYEGLSARDRRVMALAQTRSIPLVITLGGGYSEPISRTALAHANTFRTAAELLIPQSDRRIDPRRASGWHETGNQSDARQQQDCAAENGDIRRSHAVEHA